MKEARSTRISRIERLRMASSLSLAATDPYTTRISWAAGSNPGAVARQRYHFCDAGSTFWRKVMRMASPRSVRCTRKPIPPAAWMRRRSCNRRRTPGQPGARAGRRHSGCGYRLSRARRGSRNTASTGYPAWMRLRMAGGGSGVISARAKRFAHQRRVGDGRPIGVATLGPQTDATVRGRLRTMPEALKACRSLKMRFPLYSR